MRILHFACIEDDPCGGVPVAVPKHIRSQQKSEDVALVNLKNVRIGGVKHQFDHTASFSVKALPVPFCTPDIVIFHEVYYPAYLRIARELRRRRIPYIIVPHGCLTAHAQRIKRVKKRLGNLVLFRDFIEHAAALQCLSEHERDTTAFGRRIFVVPNGIELPAMSKTAFHNDCTNLLYIGRLNTTDKGLDIMLQAVALSAAFMRQHRVALSICGPDQGGQHAQLEKRIVAHGIGDIVSLEGPVIGEEKERRLLEADLFIQTSRSEGMPMGVLEALSYGLPCILTKGTAVGERVKEAQAGWVAENTAQSVAQQLERAIGERDMWTRYSANAASFIREHFALDVVARQAVEQYRNY